MRGSAKIRAHAWILPGKEFVVPCQPERTRSKVESWCSFGAGVDKVLHYIRAITPAHASAGVPDRELLARFARDRNEAAFAAHSEAKHFKTLIAGQAVPKLAKRERTQHRFV